MSATDDRFDFATLLRREAAPDVRSHSADDNDLAPVASEPSLQPDGVSLSSEAGGETGDHDASAQHESDLVQGGGLRTEQAAAPYPAEPPPAPYPVPRPADPGKRQRDGAALTTTLSAAYERLSKSLSRSFSLRAPVSPVRGIVSGAAAGVLIAGTIVVVLAHYVVQRTPDSETDFSGASKLASANPQRAEAPPAAAQESTPAGSLIPITPASFRDGFDPEIKIEGSSEVRPPERVPAVAPANVRSPAAPENTPPSELPILASMYSQPVAAQPASLTPIPPVRPTAQQSSAANETTGSISETAPSETKTTATHAEATQPHIDDASRRKRDQKPDKAVATSSCTGDVFPGYAHASARMKPGQVDVQKICADPRAPFTVSVRCLVAAVVCSDYPAEKEGKVAQKAIAPNRAASHTSPEAKSH